LGALAILTKSSLEGYFYTVAKIYKEPIL